MRPPEQEREERTGVLQRITATAGGSQVRRRVLAPMRKRIDVIRHLSDAPTVSTRIAEEYVTHIASLRW